MNEIDRMKKLVIESENIGEEINRIHATIWNDFYAEVEDKGYDEFISRPHNDEIDGNMLIVQLKPTTECFLKCYSVDGFGSEVIMFILDYFNPISWIISHSGIMYLKLFEK